MQADGVLPVQMTMNRRHRFAAVTALGLATTIAGRVQAQTPLCERERGVAGWTVTASLAPDDPGELVVSRWQTSRNFSTHFGIRVTYDTSIDPEPKLKIWHNYKSGDFTMRLPDGRSFTVQISANYTMTTANTPPEIVAYLRAAPVQIEYTTAGGKWSKYWTEGLPEAIAAAEADLNRARQRLEDKECAMHEPWWRRLTGAR